MFQACTGHQLRWSARPDQLQTSLTLGLPRKTTSCCMELGSDARITRSPSLSLPFRHADSSLRPISTSTSAFRPNHRRSARGRRNPSLWNPCAPRPGCRSLELLSLSSPRAELSSKVHLGALSSSRHLNRELTKNPFCRQPSSS